MRARAADLTLLVFALAGCGVPTPETEAPQASGDLLESGPLLVDDAEFRREILEASLVNPENGYSQLRLANYGLGDVGWDALPVRNFAVRPMTMGDVGAIVDDSRRRTPGAFQEVFDEDAFEWTREGLLELGERAFHEYPLTIDSSLTSAYDSQESVDELGLWRAEDGRVGGFVRVRLPDGAESTASTCASCHASVVDGAVVDGRSNARIDRSAIAIHSLGGRGTDWGPGVVDVTVDGVVNPVAITDLRPIRYQRRLHWAATLHNSPEALAVRIETLLITSAKQGARPPREVAVALAYYLWSLGELPTEPDLEHPGAAVFERECSACHATDGGASDPVAIASVGTDPAVGESTMRGTGTYRVPSLYRVGDRTQFLHVGRTGSLDELFEPARIQRVPGHEFGTNVTVEERRALVDFLTTL